MYVVGIQPAAGLDQSGRWPSTGCPIYVEVDVRVDDFFGCIF